MIASVLRSSVYRSSTFGSTGPHSSILLQTVLRTITALYWLLQCIGSNFNGTWGGRLPPTRAGAHTFKLATRIWHISQISNTRGKQPFSVKNAFLQSVINPMFDTRMKRTNVLHAAFYKNWKAIYNKSDSVMPLNQGAGKIIEKRLLRVIQFWNRSSYNNNHSWKKQYNCIWTFLKQIVVCISFKIKV